MGKILGGSGITSNKNPTLRRPEGRSIISSANNKCKCGREAIYLRMQEGSHYCERCLNRQVERNFEKTIAKEKMIAKGDVVAVGVSGGKDSMTLLYLMQKLSKKVPIKIIAITIDEGIRGYRDRSIETVKDFIDKQNIEHLTFSFSNEFGVSMDDIDKDAKHCTYCGVFRRALLNKAARGVGATKLAVGHNLDDEAQSVLMNVMRGDIKRMKSPAKDEKFVPRIKPLKNILEKEIVVYAMANGIPYFDGECPNSFNNVRRDAQRVINEFESMYPGTKSQIIRFKRNVKIQENPTKMNYCIKCGEPSSGEICKSCQLILELKQKI